MINAKELRVGNWVYFLGKEKQLLGLSKRNYKMETETVSYYAEFENHIPVMYVHLQPIPLTEEWLLKLGFVLDTDSHQKSYMNKTLTIYKQDGIFWCDILWNTLELKDVHQLQNLFYSLVGEDLKIK